MYSKAKVVKLKEILTLFSKQSTSNGNYFPNLLPPKCRNSRRRRTVGLALKQEIVKKYLRLIRNSLTDQYIRKSLKA